MRFLLLFCALLAPSPGTAATVAIWTNDMVDTSAQSAFGEAVFAMVPPSMSDTTPNAYPQVATSIDALHAGLLLIYVGLVVAALPRPQKLRRYPAASAISLTR